jgi:MoxR-like ATPase
MPGDYALAQAIAANVEQVIVGKSEAVRRVLAAVLCGGHVLIEDVPGVGKTVLARCFARSLGCTFKRIQFTPDLLPADVTGAVVYNQQAGGFEFRAGPIMAQVVLADEINRASPRTQSSLLECMEEGQVSVDGTTYLLPRPFLVLATQNPIEYAGTFPLPEAQLDRFLMRISLGYPTPDEEMSILDEQRRAHPLESLGVVVGPEGLLALQAQVRETYIDERVRRYIVDIVGETRRHPDVALGASPRGSLALARTAQALAFIDGRDYVLPDDVKAVAPAVLGHRLVLRGPLGASFTAEGQAAEAIVASILDNRPVPGAGSPPGIQRRAGGRRHEA